jgi:hypothetical protein
MAGRALELGSDQHGDTVMIDAALAPGAEQLVGLFGDRPDSTEIDEHPQQSVLLQLGIDGDDHRLDRSEIEHTRGCDHDQVADHTNSVVA